MAGDLVPVADLSAPAVAAEIDTIEGLMRDMSPRYWRDEAVKARYRDLLDAQEGGGTNAVADPRDEAFVAAQLAPVSIKEFDRAGATGSYSDHLAMVRHVSDVVFATPAVERAALISGFNRLPDGVVAAIAAELSDRTGTGLDYFADAQVRKFAQEKGGRVVREWGSEAPLKMARVRNRLHRCMGLMTEADEEAFLAWHDALSDGQAAAVYRKLAA